MIAEFTIWLKTTVPGLLLLSVFGGLASISVIYLAKKLIALVAFYTKKLSPTVITRIEAYRRSRKIKSMFKIGSEFGMLSDDVDGSQEEIKKEMRFYFLYGAKAFWWLVVFLACAFLGAILILNVGIESNKYILLPILVFALVAFLIGTKHIIFILNGCRVMGLMAKAKKLQEDPDYVLGKIKEAYENPPISANEFLKRLKKEVPKYKHK